MIKVEVVKGSINNGKEIFGPGKVLELEDNEAESLISLGLVKKPGSKPAVPAASVTGGAK